MQEGGLEPPRYCYRQPLKLVCLPIPPLLLGNANYKNELGKVKERESVLLAAEYSALCLVGFGERFPTLVILSKGKAKHPWELSSKEVQDLSDLTQACHRALGAETPCNEEWFFTPLDSPQAIPWMIFLKWRINTPAGFEGNTEIYINTIEPAALRDKIVETLLGLREKREIARFKIGEECKTERSALQYSSIS